MSLVKYLICFQQLYKVNSVHCEHKKIGKDTLELNFSQIQPAWSEKSNKRFHIRLVIS